MTETVKLVRAGTIAVSPERWRLIRADHAIGLLLADIAEKHGVPAEMIEARIWSQHWKRENVEADIRSRAADVVAGAAGLDPQARALAVEQEAERVASVIERHRREWAEHTVLMAEALGTGPKERSFDKAKMAKITSETIMIRQNGERRAWGIEKDDGAAKSLGEFLDELE